MMSNPPGQRCRNRVAEWLCTGIMLLAGAGMSVFDPGIGTSAFRRVLETGVTQTHIYLYVVIVGPMRAIALFANSKWPVYGPWVRALGALAGALLWSQLAMALIGVGEFTGTLTLGVYVYIGLAVGEIYSLGRALADGRRYHSSPR